MAKAKKSTSSDPLSKIKGVGPARAKKLQAAGFKTPADLANASAAEVAEKAGVSASVANKLVAAAAGAKSAPKASKPKKSAKKARASKPKPATSSGATVTKKTQAPKEQLTPEQARERAAESAASAMRDIIARARDHFRQAPDDQVFHLLDGAVLRDLKDLSEALEDMAEHVFRHHVNEYKNDFAAWVEGVLQERALAEELRDAAEHPERHQHVVCRHIVRRTW